jgi:alkylated DNA repair dioxygenase AlkB
MPAWGNVLGLSLGESVTMEFVNGVDIIPVELPPRSIYYQTGDARHAWQHSTPSVDRTRWGITFRFQLRFSPLE